MVFCRIVHFRFDTVQSEIDAGWPVLLLHRPPSSQAATLLGHEFAGIGWAKIGGASFVGILDNYFPATNPATIRWIRSDAFESLITIRPAAQK